MKEEPSKMTENSPETVDLNALRRRLEGRKGPDYWRGLEELADTEEFRSYVKQEFPQYPENWDLSATRRDFLKLMGAALAMTGLSACSSPVEKILPYAKNPEDLIPGKPWYYATAVPFPFGARGVLATSYMGRPIQIAGNSEHPDSLGACDVLSQSTLLSLYDPDRSQVVLRQGRIGSWKTFLSTVGERMDAEKASKGAGLRILTDTVLSPTLADQIQGLLHGLPGAQWHQYDPMNRDQSRAASRLAFGREVDWYYRLDQADVIFSIDADFLSPAFPGHLALSRAFSERRKPEGRLNRLYAAEVVPGLAGARADHRLGLNQRDLEHFVRAVARRVGLHGAAGQEPSGKMAQWADALAKDLLAHRGAGAVIAGPEQSPGIQTVALAMNQMLGNLGKTVVVTDRLEPHPEDQGESLRRLAEDIRAGKVQDLLILGGNPAFNAPADLEFAELLAKVPFTARLGLYEDETSALCQWHIPEAHSLESWSDALAFDGTASIIQPLIAPLYEGKTAHEFIGVLGQGGNAYDLVQTYWKRRHAANFEKFWDKSVHDGVIEGTRFAARGESLRPGFVPPAPPQPGTSLEVHFRPDPTIFDGRFANNGWLQELPKPLTKLTWDNAVLVSPATAEKLGVTNWDVVNLKLGGRAVSGAIWVQPGQPDNSVTLHFGYGRTKVGRIGNNVGFNAYALRNSEDAWAAFGLEVEKTGKRLKLAATQLHGSMEGRDLVRTADLETYRKNPNFAQKPEPAADETLYSSENTRVGHAWAMSINLNTCIGCNACVIACQSENNIPIVGKDQVLRGREMHWIRIDRYYEGGMDAPKTHFQPVTCMQCENAPCEEVCPVGATTHSKEGLNEMTYNRCVGTRYCSNNCPYKVRRYNFYRYADYDTPQIKMLYNPNVTVRERGVMEKCTYCVQRINVARIESKKSGKPIKDGEIKTACQMACPADAIVFGDLNDAESRASKLRASPLQYGLLAELNTRPRTTYLARVTNPNPEIPENV